MSMSSFFQLTALAMSTFVSAQSFAATASKTVMAENGAALNRAVAANIQEQIAKQMQISTASLHASVENLKAEPALVEGAVLRAQVLGLGAGGSRRLDGLFSLTASVETTVGEVEVQLSGVLKVIGPVAIAARNLVRERVLEPNDLSTVQMPWRLLPNGVAGLSQKALVGRRIRQSIGAGDPIVADLLEENYDVRNGDSIELVVLSGPGVIIHSRGIARQEGRQGDIIKVEQPETKKILTGAVVGEKSVEVRL